MACQIVIVNAWIAMLLAESVTFAVKAAVPFAVGVPEMTPAAERLRPYVGKVAGCRGPGVSRTSATRGRQGLRIGGSLVCPQAKWWW
jgi:hypothetical protein